MYQEVFKDLFEIFSKRTMYQEVFKDLFEIFSKARKDGQTIFEGWNPLNFASPADMAKIHKCLGIGGASKVMKFFCHCCEIISADIVKVNCGDQICGRCCNKQRQ